MNYYNEIDPFAAAWLRELIKAEHIAQGEVDERSIEDVFPNDLRGYNQCHFFAGIGGWSYALRLAGWPDDKPAWTGSCPCQSFSAAGKGAGFADKRHLWPSWFHLIEQCKPGVIFGEQVEAAIRFGWLDLVSNDLEGIGYTFAAQGIAACHLGAPHIRKRLYFVADSLQSRRTERRTEPRNGSIAGMRGFELGNSRTEGLQGRIIGRDSSDQRTARETSVDVTVDHTPSEGMEERSRREVHERNPCSKPKRPSDSSFWGSCDWIPCRDGKSRPVEPGTFPLAHGFPNRVGRLRGYGNAIVPQAAAAFIGAFLEVK